ncbi:hypothetical protein D3C73_1090140 [compost metagenome]
MSHRKVGNRRLAEQVIPLFALQLLLQARHDRRPLVPGLLGGQAGGTAATEQARPVGDERLDRFRRHIAETHRYRFRLEHQADRMLEHHRIGPRREGRGDHFLPLGEERRQGFFLLKATGDHGGVAIDVRTDLQHRSLAITTGQGGEIGLGHHGRDRHRAPGQPLETQEQPGFFGKRGRRVMMQNQLGHARLRRRNQESAA